MPARIWAACLTVRQGDAAQQLERLVELLDGLLWAAVEQGELAKRIGERRGASGWPRRWRYAPAH